MSGIALTVLAIGVAFGLTAGAGVRDDVGDWPGHQRRATSALVAAVLCAGVWALVTHGVDLLRGSAWWAAMRAGDRVAAIAAPDIDGTAGAGVVSIGFAILVVAFLLFGFMPRRRRPGRVWPVSRQSADSTL